MKKLLTTLGINTSMRDVIHSTKKSFLVVPTWYPHQSTVYQKNVSLDVFIVEVFKGLSRYQQA